MPTVDGDGGIAVAGTQPPGWIDGKPSLRVSTSDTLPSTAANRHIEPGKLSTLVRGELDWIVMKALEKDRTRRYESASDFAKLITDANDPERAPY